MATQTMTFDQAVQVFNNCLECRKMALKHELIHDPAEYKTWLEAEISRIGQADVPTDSDLVYVRRYMRHWQACDVLLKERTRQEQERKDTMADLLRTFEGMKQGRQSSVLSPFRGDTLFGHHFKTGDTSIKTVNLYAN